MKKSDRCSCGGIILADTEDWEIPLCSECYADTPEQIVSDAAWKWADEVEPKRGMKWRIAHAAFIGGAKVLNPELKLS